jgi:ABC-type bacteriocin/lantibiotic exporter with double-glycine peptidase domain
MRPTVAALVLLLHVPFFADKTDQCGPATLAEILSYWGKTTSPGDLRREMYTAKLRGTLPMDLFLTAEDHGLKAKMVQGDLPMIRAELDAGRPVLVLLNVEYALLPVHHYVVVTGWDEKRHGLYMHSSESENQFITFKKFLHEWDLTDHWAMTAHYP